MGFNSDDLSKLAHLARLETPTDIDLSAVVALFAQLEQVDTDNITPMAHPLESHSGTMREDVVTESNQREVMQKLSRKDATEAGLYLVPPVIE